MSVSSLSNFRKSKITTPRPRCGLRLPNFHAARLAGMDQLVLQAYIPVHFALGFASLNQLQLAAHNAPQVECKKVAEELRACSPLSLLYSWNWGMFTL